MRYPDPIKPSNCIGFPAPSFGCNIEPYKTCFREALKFFEGKGYKVNPGPNSTAGLGIGISNTPENCAQEFVSMYLDAANDSVIACGGGELMCEILEHIDFDVFINAAPKWFMGYSDNTNLILPLLTLCDMASIYGPCADHFGAEKLHETTLNAFDIMQGKSTGAHSFDIYQNESLKNEENPRAPFNLTEESLKSIFDGNVLHEPGKFDGEISFSGRLIGGCMDCLVNLIGTPYADIEGFTEKYASDGLIWCLEACDLNVFDIRRAMWHFEKSGWFKKGIVKGFIIGRPDNGEPMINLDHIKAVMPVIEKFGVPAVIDADLGHVPPAMPLVMGSIGHVSVKANALELEMEFA